MPATRVWTINGRFLTQSLTGVQRYAHEIVRQLDAHAAAGHPLFRDLELEIVAPPRGAKTDLGLRHIAVRTAGSGQGHAWEQVSLPRLVRGNLLSLCNSGPLTVGKQAVCIHDMNTRIVPESYSLPFRSLYRVLLPALARRARRVTTVSHFSAVELVKFGVARRDKITVIPDGHEHALRWMPLHSAATASAAGPNTIVVLGSQAPHKNLALLLGLARQFEKSGLRLAIAGGVDRSVFAATMPVVDSPSLIWLGKVSDNELAALLADCLCLALPSKTEGFGLPPVEAMARGCPVVVSNAGSLPEICGDAALYAPPNGEAEWLAQFRRLQCDTGLRSKLVARGLVAASRYSWVRSAEQYLELMADIG